MKSIKLLLDTNEVMMVLAKHWLFGFSNKRIPPVDWDWNNLSHSLLCLSSQTSVASSVWFRRASESFL